MMRGSVFLLSRIENRAFGELPRPPLDSNHGRHHARWMRFVRYPCERIVWLAEAPRIGNYGASVRVGQGIVISAILIFE